MSTPLGPNFSSRPVLRIDLKALKENYKAIQTRVGRSTHVAAAVKADAYGLGAERVSRALFGAGCRNFFVATAGEGKIVRQAIGDTASIYVLNGPAPRDIGLYFGSNLKPVINSIVQARIWADAVKKAKRAPYTAIHIDTGINRLGFSIEEFEKFSKDKKLLDLVQFDVVMSHLACASDKEHPANEKQLKAFKKAAARLPIKSMSLANTAGIYLGKPYHFQMVRPGIGLYGGKATSNPKQEITKHVVSLMAPILQIKTIDAGESVGYNATYTAKAETTIAIVGAGYADGIPVSTSSQDNGVFNHATVQNIRVPIIGRVSMDLTAIDITNVRKTPRIGDWAEFRGAKLEQDACEAGTLNYELLVRLGSRARRDFLS